MSLRSSTDIPGTPHHLTCLLLEAGCAPGEWHRAPKGDDLAAKLGVTRRSVTRWIRWLEDRKLIQRRSRGVAGLWVCLAPRLVRFVRAANGWDEPVPTNGQRPQPTEPTPVAPPIPLVPKARAIEASDDEWARALDMAVISEDERRDLRSPGGFRHWLSQDWKADPTKAYPWIARVRREAGRAQRDQAARQEADRRVAGRAERESTIRENSTLWARYHSLGERAKQNVDAEARNLARAGGWVGESAATRDAWRMSIPEATEALYPPLPGWTPPASEPPPAPDVEPPRAAPLRRTVADLLRGGSAALKEAEQETQKRKRDRDR